MRGLVPSNPPPVFTWQRVLYRYNMKRQREPSPDPLPTGRAIDVLVKSLLQLDDTLSAIDMDHAVRSQYSFIVKKWIKTAEGQIVDKLIERIAEQNERGLKARRVMNDIIHKIPPLNAEDHHHHHGHGVLAIPKPKSLEGPQSDSAVESNADTKEETKEETKEPTTIENTTTTKDITKEDPTTGTTKGTTKDTTKGTTKGTTEETTKDTTEGTTEEKNKDDTKTKQDTKASNNNPQTQRNTANKEPENSTVVIQNKTPHKNNNQTTTATAESPTPSEPQQDQPATTLPTTTTTPGTEPTKSLVPVNLSITTGPATSKSAKPPIDLDAPVDPDWVDPRKDKKSNFQTLIDEYETKHHISDHDFNDVPTEEDILHGTTHKTTFASESIGHRTASANATAVAAAKEKEEETKQDNLIDENIEYFLLQHMTIEERQLRPVAIALSCAVLFKTWSKVPRFFHLNRTCNALMRVIYTHPDQHLSIYTTEDPQEHADSCRACDEADLVEGGGTWNAHGATEQHHHNVLTVVPSLTDLLSNVPYASIVRDLEPQVEALVKQRLLMSEAQKNALARRESRKRAILRTAAKWQANMLHSYYVQWHNMTRTLKQQRAQLVKRFLTMHTPKLKDVFDAWHILSINNQLERCEEARDRTKNMMATLREQLEESKQTETDLSVNLKEQVTRRDALLKKLKETLAAIEAQRIPGTKEVMFAVANAIIKYAKMVMREPKRLLDWAAKAPSVEKIARMYWVDREERRMKERESNAQASMDEEAERQAVEKAKADEKKTKREEKDRKATEKRRSEAAAKAGQEAQDAFNTRFEAAKAEYEATVQQAKQEAAERGEDEESIAIPPFSPSELGLTLEIRQKEVTKAAASASKKILKEEQARLFKLEFDRGEKNKEEAEKTAEIIKERELKFKEQQERRDNRISASDVKEALRGMLSVPPDRLLLRW